MNRLPFAIALLACFAVPTARAEDPPGDPDDARAYELFENGADLYDDGLYEDAIAAWEEAYALSGRPLLLFNLANAYERTGQLEDAFEKLTRYRAFAKPEEREKLERRIRALEKRIDAREAREPPTENDANNDEATDQSSTTARVESPGDAVADGTSTPSDEGDVSTSDPTPLPEPPPSIAGPVVVGGLGVVALTVGVVSGLQANGARATADASCAETSSGTRLCTTDAAPSLDALKGHATRANLFLAIGGGLTAAGTGWLVVSRTSVSVGPSSIAVSGSFR